MSCFSLLLWKLEALQCCVLQVHFMKGEENLSIISGFTDLTLSLLQSVSSASSTFIKQLVSGRRNGNKICVYNLKQTISVPNPAFKAWSKQLHFKGTLLRKGKVCRVLLAFKHWDKVFNSLKALNPACSGEITAPLIRWSNITLLVNSFIGLEWLVLAYETCNSSLLSIYNIL